LEQICEIAKAAGAAIMEVYERGFNVEAKGDDSPLTCADRASHCIIADGLRRGWPDIPILSEEGREAPYAERRQWKRFWLVDPLDGTKEFIKRNGEFTVNIALVEEGDPVLGVVYVPAQNKLYAGIRGAGAWMENGVGERAAIAVRQPDPERGLTVVMSRSHPSPELETYLKSIQVAEAIEVGSSLKLCAVAEGRADLYPRLGPTMEWDTAAGQAVVESAGGKVTDLEGSNVKYNKENLLNPYFCCKG
jgi:3'(2'), 5'-bisphosphate nucleotidase